MKGISGSGKEKNGAKLEKVIYVFLLFMAGCLQGAQHIINVIFWDILEE